MTKKQMEALKPGDIVVEKATGDQFKFVNLAEVKDVKFLPGRVDFTNPRKELAVELIPGFEYSRKMYPGGKHFYFKHTQMAVKEEQ